MPRWRDGTGLLLLPDRPPVPLEIASSYRARTWGLLGRDGVEGALLLTPASGIHTFRMRFPIDVAYLDRELTVRVVRTMAPGRLGLPRVWGRHVLEGAAGSFGGWGVGLGFGWGVGPGVA
ncbi:hypothetical protein AF335_25890 [Streptomyces eurocidicus]|uniref:DUF192 domain-containing protein n=1 Tax=Streptomyces eurocidicus TaxID=66423 RepID=A0A2N8NRP8_STREU|nr:DUF192 domain-containing protein [Streptomyces eurocidicus]PNE31444.1 hypothetical protein AF335_25890 [Streptomyces eurocidicus]